MVNEIWASVLNFLFLGTLIKNSIVNPCTTFHNIVQYDSVFYHTCGEQRSKFPSSPISEKSIHDYMFPDPLCQFLHPLQNILYKISCTKSTQYLCCTQAARFT